jgi:hypothetical protein
MILYLFLHFVSLKEKKIERLKDKYNIDPANEVDLN